MENEGGYGCRRNVFRIRSRDDVAFLAMHSEMYLDDVMTASNFYPGAKIGYREKVLRTRKNGTVKSFHFHQKLVGLHRDTGEDYYATSEDPLEERSKRSCIMNGGAFGGWYF